jgi:TolB protein
MIYTSRIMSLLVIGMLSISSAENNDLGPEALRLLTEPQQKMRMPLLLQVIATPADERDKHHNLQELAQLLCDNLQRSQQFIVTVGTSNALKTTAEITQLFNEGFPLIIFINEADNGASIEWRIYDATQVVMVKGRKYYKRGLAMQGWADNLADDIWYELTGQKSSWTTRIAYSKRVGKGTHLYIVDPAGRQELLIVPSPIEQTYDFSRRIRIAPSWYPDGDNPRFVFSEFTPSNVRLVMTDLNYRRRIVLDNDGTHVGVCYAAGRKAVVFVRSGVIWRHHFDKQTGRGHYNVIVRNQHACASPNLLSNGDIIYCCKGKVYRYCEDTKVQEPLIDKGYCVGPAVFEPKQLVAYAKKINDTMQLCIYDMAQKTHTQLTYDGGDKIDPSWSPCGNWLVFCQVEGGKSRIAIMHIITKASWFLTSEEHICNYPAWSPVITIA